MRVVRNDAFIKRRTQLVQRGSLLGMGLLIASVILLSRQPLISWLCLCGGFVIAMTAVRAGNRYVRPPRPDAVLDKLLKGLDNKYTLHHYELPAEHLLLTPSGLIAILVREHRGQIVVRGKRWRHGPVWERLRVILGELGLGNPARDLRRQMVETNQELSALETGNGPVPLDGVIVFYSNKARLDVENPEFPVVGAEELKATIRKIAEARSPLPAPVRKALAAELRGEEVVMEAAS